MLAQQPEILATNTTLVSVLLVFILVSVFSCAPYGVMRQQFSFIMKPQDDRTFEEVSIVHLPIRILLLLQMVVCVGLHFFLVQSNNDIAAVNQPTVDNLWQIFWCMCIVVLWYLAHWASINWWGYIFRETGRVVLINRQFHAVYLIFSPFATLVFMCEVSGHLDILSTSILLGLFFIISQIALYYNAFKIFWGSIEVIYFIFLYLCTLEIAPLVMILAFLTK